MLCFFCDFMCTSPRGTPQRNEEREKKLCVYAIWFLAKIKAKTNEVFPSRRSGMLPTIPLFPLGPMNVVGLVQGVRDER